MAQSSAPGPTIVMATTSYPRFPGDAVGTFMQPIAEGVAARGYAVHLVAPWHPRWRRETEEHGVRFHLYRYAPTPGLSVFGYAAALRADVQLRRSALAVAPLAMLAGSRAIRGVARREHASIVHAHWVIPSGVMAAPAARRRPLLISLHGSDVFVAERHRLARRAAAAAFRRAAWVTACSEDLRQRAIRLGAAAGRTSVVPYGVDTDRFRPDAAARAGQRARLQAAADTPIVFAFGRLVEKKGFAYLIDAVASLVGDFPSLRLIIAGEGDLDHDLRARAAAAGLAAHVLWPGVVPQHEIPAWLAAADVAVVPSVHDAAGNVDGLPNAVLEIMASGTPLVATRAGGIGAAAGDGEGARLVAERDPAALAQAIRDLLRDRSAATRLGARARAIVCSSYTWSRVADRFDLLYQRLAAEQPTGWYNC